MDAAGRNDYVVKSLLPVMLVSESIDWVQWFVFPRVNGTLTIH